MVTLKRGRDDQDKDEEPSAGSNRGTKRRRSGKEESSKEATQKESKFTSSSKGNDDVSPVREIIAIDERLWNLSGSQTPEREWNKTKTIDDRPPQSWMTQLAQAPGTQSLFNEFLATPIDFYAFIINRLKLNNLTQDVLTGPTYDLMKGTCKSVVELIYHLEEVFKATNDQLDWHNPEGRPQKYTTSLTKTKAADYGHVKWIEDKVPRSISSPAQVVYDKHAYWGPKRKRFHGYATNMETSKDVYSRHRIIAVTSLKIMEFFSKLTNLNLDERFALSVALRMYTRRIVIQERVEDLQLAVKSIIYKDDMDINRLMRIDELHKFSDGTLNHVRTALNDIATGIQMEYLPKRKWSKQDK
ncbi:hypothetical protein Tco_0301052 [Tanacetum coccineum]